LSKNSNKGKFSAYDKIKSEVAMYLGKGKFPPVKNFISVIHSNENLFNLFMKEISSLFGEIDSVSDAFAFDFTDYYKPEMGKNLVRQFFSFKDLTEGDFIVEIKKKCLEFEEKFSENGKRRLNIDPGYIDLYKLVLVSEKYMGHKIYLRNGICADMVLLLGKNKITPFMWTFPDFKSGKYDEYFLSLRRTYKNQLKAKNLIP